MGIVNRIVTGADLERLKDVAIMFIDGTGFLGNFEERNLELLLLVEQLLKVSALS